MATIKQNIARKRWYGTLEQVYRLAEIAMEAQGWPEFRALLRGNGAAGRNND